MNAYVGQLAADTQVRISQQGSQTQVTLLVQRAGQQQAQSSRVQTGAWQVPPTLFRTATGGVLRLEGDRQLFLQLQAQSLELLAAPPDLSGAAVLPLQPLTEPVPASPEPLAPLPPLTMGTMSMQMPPMTMQMGDMKLSMASSEPQPEQPPSRRFCSQCGQPVAAGDRFCSACGHQLQP